MPCRHISSTPSPGLRSAGRAWLDDAVLPHLDAGDGDAYGYGFWVDPQSGDFDAIGRSDRRSGQAPPS
jgi:hypothetical protein